MKSEMIVFYSSGFSISKEILNIRSEPSSGVPETTRSGIPGLTLLISSLTPTS